MLLNSITVCCCFMLPYRRGIELSGKKVNSEHQMIFLFCGRLKIAVASKKFDVSARIIGDI